MAEVKSNIQNSQIKIKRMLEEQLKLLNGSFESISKTLSTNNEKHLVKVFINDDKVNDDFYKIVDLIIFSFLQSLYGKDLRRNIAYFQILKYILNIKHTTKSIANFISFSLENDLSISWMKKMNKEVCNLFEIVLELLENEDLEKATNLIKKEKFIEEEYQKLLDNLDSYLVLKKNIKTSNEGAKQDNLIHDKELKKIFRTRLILTSKSFKNLDSYLKDIVDSIIFIVTGNYDSLK